MSLQRLGGVCLAEFITCLDLHQVPMPHSRLALLISYMSQDKQGSCQDSTYTCRPPRAIHIMNRCPDRRIETDSLIGKMFVFEKLKSLP